MSITYFDLNGKDPRTAMLGEAFDHLVANIAKLPFPTVARGKSNDGLPRDKLEPLPSWSRRRSSEGATRVALYSGREENHHAKDKMQPLRCSSIG
jgi:hypothetical protein